MSELTNRVVNQDFFSAIRYLPQRFVSLLILDPPYNLSKKYNAKTFKEKDAASYREWFRRVLELLQPTFIDNLTTVVSNSYTEGPSGYSVYMAEYDNRQRASSRHCETVRVLCHAHRFEELWY